MKKIMRNGITKAVAFVLIMACAVAFVAMGLDIVDILETNNYAYTFDRDFDDSRAMWNATHELVGTMHNAADPVELAKRLEDLGYARYSIVRDGLVAGGQNASPEEIQQLPYWYRWTKTSTVKEDETVDTLPNDVEYINGSGAEAAAAAPQAESRAVISAPGAYNDNLDVFQLNPVTEVITETGNINFDVYAYGNDGDYEGYITLGPVGGEDCFKLNFNYGEITAENAYGYRNVGISDNMVCHITVNVDVRSQTYSAWINYEDTDTFSPYPTDIANDYDFSVPTNEISQITVYCRNMAVENLVVDNGAPVAAGKMDYIDRGRLESVKLAGATEYVDTSDVTSYMDTDGNWVYIADGATYTSYSEDNKRYVWYEMTNDWEGDCEVYLGISNEYYESILSEWTKSRREMLRSVYMAAGIVLLALLLWIYLMFVCGRKPGDDEVHTMLIDKVPVELTAVVGLGASILLAIGSGAAAFEAIDEGSLELLVPLSMFAAAAAVMVFIPTTQSLVRNLKNGTLLKRSLCWQAAKFLWKLAVRIIKFGWRLAGKILRGVKKGFFFICGNRLTFAIAALFSLYSFLIAIMGLARISLLLPLFPAALYLLCRYLWELDKIKTGIFQIRNGNVDYKVEGCKTELLRNCAEALNTINEGVKLSVEREVKAQRMKSELITNVSHDLKTPLTSIISYADLLAGMELSPKEANDYAKIVKQKGDKLKKLTQDLFDISKAESGTENVDIERLDIALLLRQSLAELDNNIQESGLSFVPAIPEREVFVRADGKKLSRVFENLLINALKYSMPGTRVYIDLREKPGAAEVEIKNISAAPMNFDPSEITERFVRGDQSRSTEGSGLGLAIAKSYAQLCGGTLDIAVDGDLFKATVKFKTA